MIRGVLSAVLGFFSPVGRIIAWLFADWRRVALLAMLMICASGWYRAWSIDGDRDRWRSTAGAEQAAHLGTILNYRIAAIHAQLIAIANRAAVEAQWRAQYQEAVHEKDVLQRDYHSRLAIWLRQQPATAGTGGNPGSHDMSAPAGMPAGTVHDATAALVPVADLERCATSFAQLAALIGFVEAAGAVETSPDQSVKGDNP